MASWMKRWENGTPQEWGDDVTRRVHTYDEAGVEILPDRAYTPEEVAAALADQAELAGLADIEARMASLEARVAALEPTPAAGSEPLFATLAGRQGGAIYAGQLFKWTDGKVYRCTVGPLNSQATPASYPQGYALLNPPAAPAWVTGHAYAVNDLASFGGKTYKCLQSHTSQAGWEPPNVAALWAVA